MDGASEAKMKSLPTAVLLIGVLVHPTLAQDQRPGEGVICAYVLYTMSQFIIETCGWDRLPIDDAVDRAVPRIEAYILANASDPSIVEQTRKNLRDGRVLANTWAEGELEAYCEVNANLESSRQMFTPAEFERNMDKLLSRPGEPTLGHCL